MSVHGALGVPRVAQRKPSTTPVIGLIAVEIYRTVTETPLEFLRTDNTCGTIVIWTRKGL